MDSKSLTVNPIDHILNSLLFQSSLEQLTTRINLLDGNSIDHIDMKLANVLGRLNTINEKKTLVDEQDKQSKVGQILLQSFLTKSPFQAVELFDMMSRWETMAANLPLIQQRLIALNELHQQSKHSNRIPSNRILLCSLSIQFSIIAL